jgi:hypothetical protein
MNDSASSPKNGNSYTVRVNKRSKMSETRAKSPDNTSKPPADMDELVFSANGQRHSLERLPLSDMSKGLPVIHIFSISAMARVRIFAPATNIVCITLISAPEIEGTHRTQLL